MEGSKAFSKDFMNRHLIPTANYRTFGSKQFEDASEYIKTCDHRVVLKASGLAAGKGVLIPETTEDALAGLKEIMIDHAFGSAGPFIQPLPLLHMGLNDQYRKRSSY